jgi:hypothetical protein
VAELYGVVSILNAPFESLVPTTEPGLTTTGTRDAASAARHRWSIAGRPKVGTTTDARGPRHRREKARSTRLSSTGCIAAAAATSSARSGRIASSTAT